MDVFCRTIGLYSLELGMFFASFCFRKSEATVAFCWRIRESLSHLMFVVLDVFFHRVGRGIERKEREREREREREEREREREREKRERERELMIDIFVDLYYKYDSGKGGYVEKEGRRQTITLLDFIGKCV